MNKKEKTKWFICGAAVALLAAALFYFAYMIIPFGLRPSAPDTLQAFKKTKEIERAIDRYYLGEKDDQIQTEMMYTGLVAGLEDPYSVYYTEEQYQELKNQRAGEYTGIGISIVQQAADDTIVIMDVQPESPAERAGLKAQDVLVRVAGQDVSGMSTSEVIKLIRENDGKEIEVTVSRAGETEPVTVNVTPGVVASVTVKGEMLEGDTGFIRISRFAGVTAEQYTKVYEDLKNQGMKKMVLDLRGNGGGLVESACSIAETILPAGVIVYEEDRNGNRRDHNGNGTGNFDLPLAVLVDGNTASAAEILTGAIQDYGIGTVVGTQTYGKGIVQNLFHLSDGSVIQLTVTHYYTPDGNDIHEKGITPDVVVEAAAENAAAAGDADKDSAAADPQLAAALEVLEG
ncbi:MAG: S41 family peptidase [Eubacterium sp.]|nr:S41 family peptidase [Eubacterium sp.]